MQKKMEKNLIDKFPSSFVGLNTDLKNDFPEVENIAAVSASTERPRLFIVHRKINF